MKLQSELATQGTAFGKYINNTYGKTELNRVNMNGYDH
jgi:hypothetical protein